MVGKNPLQRLWHGRCTVMIRSPDPVPDPLTGRTRLVERVVAIGVPCHLSFSSSPVAMDNGGAAKAEQEVKLFLGTQVEVPIGSRLTITQNDCTDQYVQSGQSAVYPSHKEIRLKRFERWA